MLPRSPDKPRAPPHRSPHPPLQPPAATPTTFRTHLINEPTEVSIPTLADPPTSNLATGTPRPPPFPPLFPAPQSTPAAHTLAALPPLPPPAISPPVRLSTPASPAPPLSRAITRSPCPSSSRRPQPGSSPPLTLHPLPRRRISAPPQLPAPTLTTSRTHFTNESIVVATSQRSPTPQPRTWPPAPHRRLNSQQPSLPCNQRRRRTHWLHCLRCHHPRPATHQLHSGVPEEPVPSLPQPAPDPIRGTRSGAVTRHPDQSQRTVYPWRACQTTPPATSKHHPGVLSRDPAP